MTAADIAAALAARAPCHFTRAAGVLLDTYAIETATCCGLRFEDHDETVVDHLVRSTRLWNAQLHDLVDNIERQAAEPLWRVAEAAREAWAAAEFADGGFDGECVDYLVPIPAMDALREALAALDAKVEETP